ncbi:hypothetical protein ACFE04_023408 [Oxalis oulophora]
MANNNYNKKTCRKDTKLVIKILKAPVRILAKARDLYVNSVSEKSTRSLTNDAEFKELIRMLSVARKVDNDLLNKEQSLPTKVNRSRTVAYGRIDEESDDCEFLIFNDVNVKSSTTDFYPRSRSVAVGSKRTTFVF